MEQEAFLIAVAKEPCDWYCELKTWQTGIGAFVGAALGLMAIIIGALYNAKLVRRRDKELREEVVMSLKTLLLNEVKSLGIYAIRQAASIETLTIYDRRQNENGTKDIPDRTKQILKLRTPLIFRSTTESLTKIHSDEFNKVFEFYSEYELLSLSNQYFLDAKIAPLRPLHTHFIRVAKTARACLQNYEIDYHERRIAQLENLDFLSEKNVGGGKDLYDTN